MIPPILMRLKIGRFGLWIPVVLFWPLLVLLEMIAWPIAVVVGLVMMPVKGWKWSKAVMMFVPWTNGLMCAMRGLSLQVKPKAGPSIDIRFI